MVMNCPNCKSDNVDLSSIGLPNAVECLECGLVFANVKQVWPFPDSLRPKKLNDNLPQRYNPANDEESPV
jgi:Zn ribbon nucleic-acid-binding protein